MINLFDNLLLLDSGFLLDSETPAKIGLKSGRTTGDVRVDSAMVTQGPGPRQQRSNFRLGSICLVS